MDRKIFLAGALALVTSGAFAQDGRWTLGTGLHYSSGDYGTGATTTILSLPFTARYDTGPWSLRASVPYLEVSGPSAVIPGVGPVSNSNPRRRGRGSTAASEGTASGVGDTTLAATYTAYPGIDVTGKVKLATADPDQGLGTGEHDAAVLVDAYRTFDRVTLFGGVGYHMLGSSPYIPLENVWSASLGGSYRIDQRDSAGLAFDARQRASPTGFPQRELTAFFERRLDRAWKAQAYLLKGFANGSPDWGAGATVGYSF